MEELIASLDDAHRIAQDLAHNPNPADARTIRLRLQEPTSLAKLLFRGRLDGRTLNDCRDEWELVSALSEADKGLDSVRQGRGFDDMNAIPRAIDRARIFASCIRERTQSSPE